MVKNYYVVLGLQANATPEQIRSAYRRRALELHPDHTGTDSEAFLTLQEAYHVLNDPARRHEYDHRQQARAQRTQPRERGEPLRMRHATPEPLKPPRRAQDLGVISLEDDFQTYSPSIEDIVGRLWSNFAPGPRPKAETVRSLTVDIPITAEQAFYGGSARLQVPALVPCPTCEGEGTVGPFECLRCGGHGKLMGACAVSVSFPPDLTSDYVTQIPLDRFGIHNCHLIVRFRVSDVLA